MINKKLGLAGVAAGVAAVALWATAYSSNRPEATSESVPAVSSAAADGPAITVYRSASCGCCKGWVAHLEESGFRVEDNVTEDIMDVKREYGVPQTMQSCHTAVMGDRVIEGHVPAEDILAYRDKSVFNTVGLAVPGMVAGSPGMETGTKQDYAVVAFSANGQSSVYREYTDY
ncbi:DUF411 domain-containing protein [Marinobacter sp. R17]|uniref:DUF411 domain-containing protein n=1 Tax=Marinobacter sp. R17 TaxID=2484250 RepID=UPI000F4C46F6|nr:DUF411 domain-containing protein [Marinobacter sp. R17]ROU00456.1 DUF411 domain-containing protein [Marinobacter sp. R17]